MYLIWHWKIFGLSAVFIPKNNMFLRDRVLHVCSQPQSWPTSRSLQRWTALRLRRPNSQRGSRNPRRRLHLLQSCQQPWRLWPAGWLLWNSAAALRGSWGRCTSSWEAWWGVWWRSCKHVSARLVTNTEELNREMHWDLKAELWRNLQ